MGGRSAEEQDGGRASRRLLVPESGAKRGHNKVLLARSIGDARFRIVPAAQHVFLVMLGNRGTIRGIHPVLENRTATDLSQMESCLVVPSVFQ